jgi:hypothetical protein
MEIAERVLPDTANNQSLVSTHSFSNPQEIMMLQTLKSALDGPQNMLMTLSQLQKSGFQWSDETTRAINERIQQVMMTTPTTMGEVPGAMAQMRDDYVRAQEKLWRLKEKQMLDYSKGVRSAATTAEGTTRATTGLIEDSVKRHVTPLKRRMGDLHTSITKLSQALTSTESKKRKRAAQPAPAELEMDASDDDEEEEDEEEEEEEEEESECEEPASKKRKVEQRRRQGRSNLRQSNVKIVRKKAALQVGVHPLLMLCCRNDKVYKKFDVRMSQLTQRLLEERNREWATHLPSFAGKYGHLLPPDAEPEQQNSSYVTFHNLVRGIQHNCEPPENMLPWQQLFAVIRLHWYINQVVKELIKSGKPNPFLDVFSSPLVVVDDANNHAYIVLSTVRAAYYLLQSLFCHLLPSRCSAENLEELKPLFLDQPVFFPSDLDHNMHSLTFAMLKSMCRPELLRLLPLGRSPTVHAAHLMFVMPASLFFIFLAQMNGCIKKSPKGGAGTGTALLDELLTTGLANKSGLDLFGKSIQQEVNAMSTPAHRKEMQATFKDNRQIVIGLQLFLAQHGLWHCPSIVIAPPPGTNLPVTELFSKSVNRIYAGLPHDTKLAEQQFAELSWFGSHPQFKRYTQEPKLKITLDITASNQQSVPPACSSSSSPSERANDEDSGVESFSDHDDSATGNPPTPSSEI